MELHKTRNVFTVKETIYKMKRQPVEFQKILTYDTSDKRLISKIYTELLKLNTRKSSNTIKNGQRTWIDTSPERTYRCMKRCSLALIIREMQIKTTMRFLHTPVRRAVINKSTNNKSWWGYGEKNTLVHSWQECRLVLCSHYGKHCGGSSRN